MLPPYVSRVLYSYLNLQSRINGLENGDQDLLVYRTSFNLGIKSGITLYIADPRMGVQNVKSLYHPDRELHSSFTPLANIHWNRPHIL